MLSVPSQVRPDPSTKSTGSRVGSNLDVTESSKRARGTEKEAMDDGCLFFHPFSLWSSGRGRNLEPGRKFLRNLFLSIKLEMGTDRPPWTDTD